MKKIKTFDFTFYIFLLIFLIFLYISISILPALILKIFNIGLKSTEQIGNSFGNFVGTLVAMVAAFLTFIAFWVQYKANRQQWQSIQIDRLENRLYEMLNLHRQNVNELEYWNEKGRASFIFFYKELKYIYLILDDMLQKKLDIPFSNKRKDISSMSYLIFFIGINERDNKYLKKLLEFYIDEEAFDDVVNGFLTYKDNAAFIQHFHLTEDEMNNSMTSLKLEGQSQRLGHYFRHLFQMVKYIDEYPSNIITQEDKYNYVKTIRAQLSNYEQLLLYYNTFSPFGYPWIELKYITKYKMIKNIPLPLADFGVNPIDNFKKEIAESKSKGEEFFEWSE